MGNIRKMNWQMELFDSVRDKFVLEKLNEKRLLNLIIQRIIGKIKTNDMNRVLFYITELAHDGNMNTTYLTSLVRVLCDYKRYKVLGGVFKNRLAHCGMVDLVLNIAYSKDDVELLKTVILNHTNDYSSMIDMIYQSITKGAQNIVLYLLRTFEYCTDDILIACIDMEMSKVIYYILNLGVVSDIDNVFTAICSINNISLVKKYMMLFPNVNTMNGMMIATANGHTDIIEYLALLANRE